MKLTKEIQDFILDNGGICGYQVNREEEGMMFEEGRIPIDTECILVVGGDGTLLRAARNMAERNIPLIGINTGHVGYLCELEKDSAIQGIQRLLEGADYVVEQRMLLSGSCISPNRTIAGRLALNDIVIHRCGALQAMDFVISVNGEHLNTYNADGIISYAYGLHCLQYVGRGTYCRSPGKVACCDADLPSYAQCQKYCAGCRG